MTTFSNEVREAIVEAQNACCRSHRCVNPIHSIHHRLQRTKTNVKLFPLFIDSPMNGVGLCYYHHSQESHLYRVTEAEAKIYEAFLEDLASSIMWGKLQTVKEIKKAQKQLDNLFNQMIDNQVIS